MKAAVLHAPGDLRVEAAPDPVADTGRVVLRVGACGICGSDLPRIFKTGTYRFPTIPGHEFYGEVVAVGEDCGRIEPGMWGAVSPLIPCGDCYYCRSQMAFHCERYDFLGSRSDGGFAERVSAPADNLIRVDAAGA